MIGSRTVAGLLTVLLAVIEPRQPAAVAAEGPMNQLDQDFGTPNPNAPAALSRFAFLVGRWRCVARVKSADGGWQTYQAQWLGRFILDGHAIADEYRMTDASGTLIVLGMNFRAYDVKGQAWNIKWLNALSGTWVDLAPEELGGVRFDGPSIIYAFKEPMATQTYTRATYTSVSETHFTWRGEGSDDGKTWSEFMVIEAHRARE
jgi:hypothetical protein